MNHYTQAIAVDESFMYTLLIRRENNPGKGLLSGIGGHIEDGEDPNECMLREWEEEMGSALPDDAVIRPLMAQTLTDCTNHIFGIIIPKIDIYFYRPMDEGYIRWYHILGDHIMDCNNPNLAWNRLTPYCLNLLNSDREEQND